MNIKQLKYVVATVNTGTFKEASKQLFVSQPSISMAVRDLETELGFAIFERTNTGVVLTPKGESFYEQAQGLLKQFESLEARYSQVEEEEEVFSIASQHYDFLAQVAVEFSEKNPTIKTIRMSETTTFNILTEVAEGHSDLGLVYLNQQNRASFTRMMDKLGLDYQVLIQFDTHIYLGDHHPLTAKEGLLIKDLKPLDRVRFTQEKDQFLYYSEDLVETFEATKIYQVTDRASLNGILSRTQAYATGSGFLDESSSAGIVVRPLLDGMHNELIMVLAKNKPISPQVQSYVRSLQYYFAQRGQLND